MTEWNAAAYSRHSSLQEAMADEVLRRLDLEGSERVLDVGCGDGKITTQLASRVPHGRVVGVDASQQMIAFASSRLDLAARPNLQFEVADACRLPFRDEFDLVVSFNALHWIPDQGAALRSIRLAMKPSGRGLLRLVPDGERESLENVVEETRRSPRFARYFRDFHDPYLHLTPEQYVDLARRSGLRVLRVHTEAKRWDFGSRPAFAAFCAVGCVAWTERLPDAERPAFIDDVLDRYRSVAADRPGEENVFKFYQMEIALTPEQSETKPG